MVFYRKYRPQKIEELDNEAVRLSLYATFAKESSAHAFLFTGPKGLGKTSTARIVAKVINCEKHLQKSKITEKDIEPCNKCSQCISITNGNNLDVLEIDGASNRGIDEIRDLKEKINLAPFKASKKIYVIDEVHMLTTEAFNALLKTLEEPPSHAVFILCTTELQKVPATIASRCFKINFTKATEEELVRSLERIVKAEEIKIEKDALLEIAKISGGSFRDGAKTLEEVVSFTGRKKITKDLVNEKFNTLGIDENVTEVLDALIKKDVKKGLAACRELTKQGMDFKFFIEQLIEKLHLMLLQEVGFEKIDTASGLNLAEIRKLFVLLSQAHQDTKNAVMAQIPLELAILEWGEVVDDKNALRSQLDFNEFSNASVPANLGIRPAKRDLAKTSSQQAASRAEEDVFFIKLIEEVKKQNNLLAGVLRSCSAEDIENGKLIIIAPSKFHKEKLEEHKTLKFLEESIKQIINTDIQIRVQLKGVKVNE